MKKTYLILRIQRDNTRLMGLDNILTSPNNLLIRLARQLLRRKQEQEPTLQQINAEEKRHIAQIRVVLEDVGDGLGGGDGVGHCVLEGRGADPEVVVVEEVDRVPFAGDEDVQDMHDVGAVGDDDFGLDYGVGESGGAGGAGDGPVGVHGWRRGVGFVRVIGVVGVGEVARFKFVQAAAVGFEQGGDFVGSFVPFDGIVRCLTEAGMVAGLVEIDDVAEDGHQGREVAKDTVISAKEDGAGGAVVRAVEVPSMEIVVVLWLEKVIALHIK